MENAIAVAAVAGPAYLVLGLSLLVYSKSWQKLIAKWQKDHFSLIAIMIMTLILGLVVLRMYSAWETNVWILVTITGWAMVLKGAFYLLAPERWIKDWVAMAKSEGLIGLGGVVTIAIGAVLSYHVYLA